MRNSLYRTHSASDALRQNSKSRGWKRPVLVVAMATLLIGGAIAIMGSGDDTQAAPRPALASNEFRDRPNVPHQFQFVGQGRITGGSDDMWIIGNVPIKVNDLTQLSNDLHPGDFVTLSGRLLPNKVWLADRIEATQEEGSFFTFNGPLEWVRGTIWRIGGHSVFVNLQTEVGKDLEVNDILLATFTALEDGAWLALEIKAFDPTSFEPTPTPTSTSSPTKPKQKVDPTATATTIPTSAEHYEEREEVRREEDEDEDEDEDEPEEDKERDEDEHEYEEDEEEDDD